MWTPLWSPHRTCETSRGCAIEVVVPPNSMEQPELALIAAAARDALILLPESHGSPGTSPAVHSDLTVLS
jgi:hypothetical protein